MTKKILIIAHIIHREIIEEECKSVVLREWPEAEVSFVEVRPYGRLKPLGERIQDWVMLKEKQKLIFEKFLQPCLSTGTTIAYFATAPIPVMLHLGSLLHDYYKVQAFTYHRVDKSWYLNKPRKNENKVFKNYRYPVCKDESNGNIIIRLSVSALIEVETTQIFDQTDIQEVDISLENIGLDALDTQESLHRYTDTFINLLQEINKNYPNAQIHLFAALPTGLSFLITSKITPTMQASLQTYQYQQTATIPYEPAIIINPKIKTILVLTANQVTPNDAFIKVEEEASNIKNILATGNAREQYIVKIEHNVSYQDALILLEKYQPTIVHIASHGDETGVNLYHNNQRFSEPNDQLIYKQQILDSWQAVFSMYRRKVQCVALNACQSEQMAFSIAQQVPYVAGFRETIDDQEALSFSNVFYNSLSNEYNIEKAFKKGSACVSLDTKGKSIASLYKNGKKL